MFASLRVSALSIKPAKWDKAGNADKLEAFLRKAAREKPRVIVTPEGVLEGYVVNEVIRDPGLADAMREIAEPIDGPYVRRFRGLARRLRVCLCLGFAERVGRDVYNAAIFIGHDGKICGKHHKCQLAEGTHPDWTFNRVGRRLRAFDTPIGRAGILICSDRRNPMIARALVLDGARILLIPTYGANGRAQNEIVLARARENGVPIVQANVGMNLIVSKGDIAAYHWGRDHVTTATVEIPEAPSPRAARAMEREYLRLQPANMRRRYLRTLRKLKGRGAARS
jgi:predicted amidohydrolase